MPHLKAQDTEIYYEVHGDGPPFLFCSVTGLDHQAWKFHQVREFSRDHKVIVFDYRGTGKSSKAVQKYSIKMFTDDAAAILDHLDAEQAIVCGHSMGGVVAQLLALDHPNKVKKLILASSGSSHPGAKGIPLAMCRDMVRMGFESYIRQHTIETGWTKEFVAAHPDLIEKFLQVRLSGIAPLENYLHFVLARQEHDHTDRLKEIRVPTSFWLATTKNTARRIKLTGTRPMSLPVRFPMPSSSYYRARDIITLRRIQMSRIKRSGSLSASRPIEKAS